MTGIVVNHIALAVSDWATSHRFYRQVLGALGAREAMGGTGKPHRQPEGRWCMFDGGVRITLWEAVPELADRKFEVYAPGLHHLAFSAPDRPAVDAMVELVRELGAEIVELPQVDAPSYVLFFLDPDGIKLEYRVAAA